MLRLALLLALLALVSSAHADARAQRVESVLARAERDLARGAAAAAVLRLSRALARDAEDPRLVLRFAELALPLTGELSTRELEPLVQRAEHLLRAEERTRADTKSAPLDAERARTLALHLAWANALRERDDDSLAQVYAAGRLQDRATLDCLRQIAALAVLRDRLALAERALSLARQYVPQAPALASELGHVLLARGESEAAVTLLAEHFAIDPRDLGARRDFAYALAAAGRASEGYGLLASERAACNADPRCAIEAARIALEAGRTNDALAHAGARLAANASDLEALFVSADAHTRAGHFADARGVYQRILAIRPDNARARQALEQLPAGSSENVR
jgi:tetratricopeptide (TPR) repeat protein